MAEEKKFADEVLNEEELDGVAGGGPGETYEDSVLLHKLGLCGEYTLQDFTLRDNRDAVKQAWQKVGIDCHPKNGKINLYYLDGTKILRSEALEHAKKFMSEN